MERLEIRGERISPESAMAFELRSSCVASSHPPPAPPHWGDPLARWHQGFEPHQSVTGRASYEGRLRKGGSHLTNAGRGDNLAAIQADASPPHWGWLTFLGVSQHTQLLGTNSLRACREAPAHREQALTGEPNSRPLSRCDQAVNLERPSVGCSPRGR